MDHVPHLRTQTYVKLVKDGTPASAADVRARFMAAFPGMQVRSLRFTDSMAALASDAKVRENDAEPYTIECFTPNSTKTSPFFSWDVKLVRGAIPHYEFHLHSSVERIFHGQRVFGIPIGQRIATLEESMRESFLQQGIFDYGHVEEFHTLRGDLLLMYLWNKVHQTPALKKKVDVIPDDATTPNPILSLYQITKDLLPAYDRIDTWTPKYLHQMDEFLHKYIHNETLEREIVNLGSSHEEWFAGVQVAQAH